MFTIEDHEIKGDIISISHYKEEWDKCKTIEVGKMLFELWLEDADRLTRTQSVYAQALDFYDELTADISSDDYWAENDTQIIRKDLHDYLSIHHFFEDGLDIVGAINKLFEPFKTAV